MPSTTLILITSTLGILGTAINRTHFLSTLLSLELILISLFSGLTLWANSLSLQTILPTTVILLSLSACEASAGLALLVSMSRTHGSDLVRSLNLLQC